MNQPKTRSHHPERITLSPEALEKVNTWISIITPRLKGTSLNRSELISWVVMNQPKTLSEPTLKEIERYFFDPVKALAWASAEVTKRRKSGEQIDIRSLVEDLLKNQDQRNSCQKKVKRTKYLDKSSEKKEVSIL